MALESLKAQIGMLMEMFSNPAHDRYELYVELKEKINEMRVFGMTPPADLVQLEEALDAEFTERQAKADPPAS